MKTGFKRVFVLLLTLALILVAVLALWNRQLISDHLQAAGFEAGDRIEDIEDSLLLTGAGERIFLATRPTIEASQHFNEQCAQVDHAEEGHVLGCYAQGRIHLFDVADDRLDGIVEVTAAHELLHASYERIRESDRERLSEELLAAYEELSEKDEDLRERMAVYEHLPEASFVNELHSVLGTEVRDLPEGLERHYAEWFSDREIVLDLFEGYHSVFVDLQAEADALNDELAKLRTEYEERSSAYDASVDRYNADSRNLSERNQAYEFSDDPAEFDRLRADLDRRRGELEAEHAALNDIADRYEERRARLKKLSETSVELDQHLNSDLAPPADSPD